MAIDHARGPGLMTNGDRRRRHVVPQNFLSVQVNHRPIIAHQLEAQRGNGVVAVHHEHMAEIGGDMLGVGVPAKVEAGRLVPVPVAERRLAGFPSGIVEARLTPRGALVRAVVQIVPGGTLADQREFAGPAIITVSGRSGQRHQAGLGGRLAKHRGVRPPAAPALLPRFPLVAVVHANTDSQFLAGPKTIHPKGRRGEPGLVGRDGTCTLDSRLIRPRPALMIGDDMPVVVQGKIVQVRDRVPGRVGEHHLHTVTVPGIGTGVLMRIVGHHDAEIKRVRFPGKGDRARVIVRPRPVAAGVFLEQHQLPVFSPELDVAQKPDVRPVGSDTIDLDGGHAGREGIPPLLDAVGHGGQTPHGSSDDSKQEQSAEPHFNSSRVLPPCLRRRSAVTVDQVEVMARRKWMIWSAEVSTMTPATIQQPNARATLSFGLGGRLALT